MAELTYFVALPFIAADDGVAAGEPTECFNPTAVVIRAEALSRKPGHIGGGFQPNRRSRHRRLRRCEDHQEIRRSAGRSQYLVGAQASGRGRRNSDGALHRQQCVHSVDAENTVRDHCHDGGRSG